MDLENLKDDLYRKLDKDKIKINWNKNPIRMDLFLSFLIVETKVSTDHLGYSNGWTLRTNDKYKLEIQGGFIEQVEWLDNVKFGEKLENSYNNWVSPFYLFDIMTDVGKKFFVDYYKDEIETILQEKTAKINQLEKQIKKEKEVMINIKNEVNWLRSI